MLNLHFIVTVHLSTYFVMTYFNKEEQDSVARDLLARWSFTTDRLIFNETKYFIECTIFEKAHLKHIYTGSLQYTHEKNLNPSVLVTWKDKCSFEVKITNNMYMDCDFVELNGIIVCFCNIRGDKIEYIVMNDWFKKHYPHIPKCEANDFDSCIKYVLQQQNM